MIDYSWEPCAPYYPGNIRAESSAGMHYYMLCVEMSNEGWHSLLLVLEDNDEGAWVADEQTFSDQWEAQEWCEDRDTKRFLEDMEQENDDSEAAFWEEMIRDDYD